jgi:hypothetical protein
MPGLRYQVATGEVSLTAATARTLIAAETTAGTQPVFIKGIEIFGKGIANADTPIKVELIKATSFSGGTGGTLVQTPLDFDLSTGSIQTTYNGNYTAEPTFVSPTTIRTWEVHPQRGFVKYFNRGDEIRMKSTSACFALRLTSTQNETVSVNLIVEE